MYVPARKENVSIKKWEKPHRVDNARVTSKVVRLVATFGVEYSVKSVHEGDRMGVCMPARVSVYRTTESLLESATIVPVGSKSADVTSLHFHSLTTENVVVSSRVFVGSYTFTIVFS